MRPAVASTQSAAEGISSLSPRIMIQAYGLHRLVH